MANTQNEEKEVHGLSIELPKVVGDAVLPQPENLNFYRLYEKRSIYVTGDIDMWILEVSRMIHIFNIEDAGKPVEERMPIKIFIFTNGGDLMSTWNFIDVVNISKTPVYTINYGMCMSAGLLMLAAGHKRFALPHSVGLYHSGSAEFEGTREQIDSLQKWYESNGKILEKWFLSKCDVDIKMFNRKKKTDWYLTAEELLEYKIIDRIIENIDEVI